MSNATRTIKIAGAALAAYYLSDKKNRDKLKHEVTKAAENPEQFVGDMIEQVEAVKRILTAVYMELWGDPAEEEDGRMVAEGALTSVQYFNRNQEEAAERRAPDHVA